MKLQLTIQLLLGAVLALVLTARAPTDASGVGTCLRSLARKVGLSELVGKCSHPDYRAEYKQINEFLEKTLSNQEHPADNLAAAKAWLEQLRTADKWSQRSLVGALESFVALTKLDPAGKLCQLASGDILEVVDLFTDESSHRLRAGGLASSNRLERILFDYAMRHVDQCPEQLKLMFDKFNSRIPPELKRRVRELMEQLIASHLIYDHFGNHEKDSPTDLMHFIEQNPLEVVSFEINSQSPLGNERDLEIMFNFVDKISKNEYRNVALHQTDRDNYVRYAQVEGLFAEHLVNMCDDYRNWYDSVIEPLEYDFQFLNKTELLSAEKPNELDLMQTIAFYEGCGNLVTNQNVIRKNFIKYVKWHIQMSGL